MANEERIIMELLETVIQNEGIKNPEIKIKPISTGGANYTSTLHYITIQSYGRENLELFAKVACVGEQVRKVMRVDRMYATERFVYQDLSKIYDRLQAQSNIPEKERLVFPKFYACSDKYLEETLILENLVMTGYNLYDRFKSVNWEYASKAIGELAKLHALSHAFQQDDPEKFAQVVADIEMPLSGNEEEMVKMWKTLEASALEMVPVAYKAKLNAFFDRESGLENFMKHYKFARGPVFVHGDYRCSNIMHKRKNGKLESLIPVDYQTLHAGSPLTDLLYFIFCGTDEEFRRLHYKRLIDYYYTTFADFLTKLGLDSNVIYPRQHFNEDYKKTLPFGMLISTYILPIVLVDTDNIPTMEGNAAMSNMAVKGTDTFKKRFLGVFKNYTEWGII